MYEEINDALKVISVQNMAMVHNLYCYVDNTMQVRGGCVAR